MIYNLKLIYPSNNDSMEFIMRFLWNEPEFPWQMKIADFFSPDKKSKAGNKPKMGNKSQNATPRAYFTLKTNSLTLC